MGSKPLPGGLLRLLLESLLVFSPGIVFLWTYARRFQAADGAVLQHATVVATALLLYAAIRFLIVAWGQGRRTGRFLSTLLASGVLSLWHPVLAERLCWPLLVARNLVFTIVVLGHGLARVLRIGRHRAR